MTVGKFRSSNEPLMLLLINYPYENVELRKLLGLSCDFSTWISCLSLKHSLALHLVLQSSLLRYDGQRWWIFFHKPFFKRGVLVWFFSFSPPRSFSRLMSLVIRNLVLTFALNLFTGNLISFVLVPTLSSGPWQRCIYSPSLCVYKQRAHPLPVFVFIGYKAIPFSVSCHTN